MPVYPGLPEVNITVHVSHEQWDGITDNNVVTPAGTPPRPRSHGYDLDEIAERTEIVRVAGVERQAGGARGRRQEEVDGTRPSRLASRGYHSGINPPIRACRLGIEGQRIEGGFRALEPVLAARPLFGVRRGVRTGGKLGHRDCADGNLDRKP